MYVFSRSSTLLGWQLGWLKTPAAEVCVASPEQVPHLGNVSLYVYPH